MKTKDLSCKRLRFHTGRTIRRNIPKKTINLNEDVHIYRTRKTKVDQTVNNFSSVITARTRSDKNYYFKVYMF